MEETDLLLKFEGTAKDYTISDRTGCWQQGPRASVERAGEDVPKTMVLLLSIHSLMSVRQLRSD